MRIVDLEAIALLVPVRDLAGPPFYVRYADQIGSVLFRGYTATIVRVTDADGRQGIGECGSRMAPTVTKAIVDELRPLIVGHDAASPDVIWSRLFATLASAGHSKGFFVEALSGVDIALWDLRARAAGVPLHQLLGGARAESLPVYGSGLTLGRDFDELLLRAEDFASRGYHMIKAKIGADVEQPGAELEKLQGLVHAFGDRLRFVVDANGVYDFRTALRVGRELDRLGIVWFEEPVPAVARTDQAELARRLDTPIAGGEAEHTRFHFRDIVLARAYDILQPNVARAGGVGECMRVIALCDAFGLGYAPHVGSSSAVCIATTLHLAAVAESFRAFEHMGPGWSPDQPNPLRSELATQSIETVIDGKISIPTTEGHGVVLDEDVIERWRVA